MDCKENTIVSEIKKMIEGILKVQVENQLLYKDKTAMEDSKTVARTMFKRSWYIKLLIISYYLRVEIENFETLEILSLSLPPELPEVMRTQDQSPLQVGSENK